MGDTHLGARITANTERVVKNGFLFFFEKKMEKDREKLEDAHCDMRGFASSARKETLSLSKRN